MKKTFRILEIIWLSMAFIGVLMCAFNIMGHDTRGAIYFLVFTFASGLMYAVRRRQRIKFEAKQNEQK